MAMYRGPTKVISGGQSGADIAALRAARECSIETGGHTVEYLMRKYRLANYNMTVITDLVARSKRNVDDADGVIAFMERTTPGTACTIVYATHRRWRITPIPKQYVPVAEVPRVAFGSKPVLRVQWVGQYNRENMITSICAFLKRYRIKTLNVCGSRTPTTCWEEDIERILVDVFNELKSAQEQLSESE